MSETNADGEQQVVATARRDRDDPEKRVALGEALRRRAAEVARLVNARWEERRSPDASPIPAQVLRDIGRTTETATVAVADFLVTGQLPTEQQARVWNATGKAPLRNTIMLADLTKLYLYWRDVTLSVARAEVARLGVGPQAERLAVSAIRAGADASIVRMARTFDTERRRLQSSLEEEQARLRHQALHDALTGLPNRVLFFDRLTHAFDAASRRATGVAVLFIDIDHFKSVNDAVGHANGDALLRSVATRLRAIVRSNDTVARFAGDEFLVLYEDLRDPESEAVVQAQRVLGTFVEPFVIDDHDLRASASVGIAIASPGSSPDTLLIAADRAMYLAKQHGRARYELAD